MSKIWIDKRFIGTQMDKIESLASILRTLGYEAKCGPVCAVTADDPDLTIAIGMLRNPQKQYYVWATLEDGGYDGEKDYLFQLSQSELFNMFDGGWTKTKMALIDKAA